MKVSIIIPTYNEEKYIEKSLAQILSGSDNRLKEIIVVDGQSTDYTEKVVRQFPEVIFIQSQRAGRATQMNYGASVASGDVFYFVHADTLVPKDYLDDIEQSIKAGFSHGSYSFQFDSKRAILKVNNYFTRLKLSFVRGGDQTLFIKREDFEKIGGYDEEFVIMEEYELLRKLKSKGTFKLMGDSVIVSARKYEKNSYLRVLLSNVLVFSLYKLKVHPVKLKKIYNTLLN